LVNVITTNTMAINKTKCKKIAWIIFEHILISRIFAIMVILIFSSRFFRDLNDLPIFSLYLYNFALEIILRIILRKNKKKRMLIISYKIASHCFIFLFIVLLHFHFWPYGLAHSNFFTKIIHSILWFPYVVMFLIAFYLPF
jgi:hypothetical protein